MKSISFPGTVARNGQVEGKRFTMGKGTAKGRTCSSHSYSHSRRRHCCCCSTTNEISQTIEKKQLTVDWAFPTAPQQLLILVCAYLTYWFPPHSNAPSPSSPSYAPFHLIKDYSVSNLVIMIKILRELPEPISYRLMKAFLSQTGL